MLKSYKTEILPNKEQQQKIFQTIGTCRFVYNFYIAYNKSLYQEDKPFMNAYDFNKWLNNEYIPNNPNLIWIKSVSSKAVKKSIMNANQAFTNFFKHKSDFPKFKKRGKSDVKMYFVNAAYACERHRVKIPTLGWVKLKEKGYIPLNTQNAKSGSISYKSGRFYVSVLYEVSDIELPNLSNDGLGIDLGVKDFAILSNGRVYPNINKCDGIRKLEKQIKREQRCLSRKCKGLSKAKRVQGKNIQKQTLKLQKLYSRLANIHEDYINKIVCEIVKTKPSYVTIEDLNVSGMLKNRHLSKSIASQSFYSFRTKLTNKCKEYGIELRIVDRFYPSSKMCHCCGAIKSDLKLSDRTYICKCGYANDRDLNAALNLRDCLIYNVVK